MVQYTAAMGKVSFEEETTFGTDPATTRDYLGIVTSIDHSYTKNPSNVRGIGSRNVRQIVELGTDVEVSMEVQCQNFHWAYMALGGGSLTSPSESNSLPSFTIERTLDDSSDITFIYTGCVLNTCEVSMSEDDLITASLSFNAAYLYRKDSAAATHATVDTDRVSGFYDAKFYAKGVIGVFDTSDDNDEWVGDGDGSTASFYSNHYPKSTPTPEVYVDGTAQGVTLGTIEDPDDVDITTGNCYWNTSTGEITFKSTDIPSAGEEITCEYEFDYEEISAKTQSLSFSINNNVVAVRGIGSKNIRQLPPTGRDYTGSCTFYTQDADQVDWTYKFQNALTLKVAITFGATTKNFEFANAAFGGNSESWSEADIVTDDMEWQAESLTIS